MLTRPFADDDDDDDDDEQPVEGRRASDVEAPEYAFEGFEIEISQRVVLTPPVPAASSQVGRRSGR